MVPEPLQIIILEHCHDKPGAGHMGMNKTTQRVKRYAIWYKMLDSWIEGSSGTILCKIVPREDTY